MENNEDEEDSEQELISFLAFYDKSGLKSNTSITQEIENLKN